MSKHTKGPWNALPADEYGMIDVLANTDMEGTLVSRLYVCPNAEEKANANLIAAAPDLLDACKRALLYLGTPKQSQIAELLATSIAKAEGRDV